jgi:antitoxin (DNA-binding transcriptional repressor) of toxin-antitoxin stability system
MSGRTIHVSDVEAVGDFASMLDRVRAGDEIVIEHNSSPVAVLRPAAPAALGGSSNGLERERSEFRWLALNRKQYGGRRVALDGDALLAVADSAREVFAAVASYKGTPLVTRVEPEGEVYFAG